jgi:hypothetical protein
VVDPSPYDGGIYAMLLVGDDVTPPTEDVELAVMELVAMLGGEVLGLEAVLRGEVVLELETVLEMKAMLEAEAVFKIKTVPEIVALLEMEVLM